MRKNGPKETSISIISVSSSYSQSKNSFSEISSNSSSITLDKDNIKLEEVSLEKKDLFEFELSYINKEFKVLEKEEINGHNFENNVKRFLYIMLFLLKIDYYEFLHPEEVLYKELRSSQNYR